MYGKIKALAQVSRTSGLHWRAASSEGTSSKCLLELGRNGNTHMPMHMKLAVHTKLWKPSQENRLQVGTGSCWHSHESGHRIPDCTGGLGSELLSRASPGSCARIALTKHPPERQNATGNLQDFGAKSYWVFCKVRSLKSSLSFGGHRGWLLTATKTCCQTTLLPNP